ncbi:sporulation protein [Micromonospora aurantiaca (nom. illeg.)]|uniref:sporulation protein n=1 Tax=Micromonospora aurantiaca (nom. illeg.) TaxID=47850 RepID=UPI0001BF4A9A|nr:sporulation protein [Micromonospora aurantiaca]ADL44188.1 SpoOM family protein [Micromonospora aurantiaca ATCC 27029]
MVFKKMLGAFGVGGPSVDTVLSNPSTRPGLMLGGQVNLTGGSHDVEIDHITVGLVTRVEIDGAEEEYDALVEFHRVQVAGGLHLREGQQLSLPFQVAMPWETPVTDLYGQNLHDMTMGLRTEVAIRGAIDKGDLDPVYVHPLPVQERILEAFGRLGFGFKGADLERGHISGLHQSLPFYQEIEYYAAPQYAHGVNEVELTFVANEHGVDVVLEFDKRGDLFTGGHDSYGRYHAAHADADRVDWAAQVDTWVRQALDGYQSLHTGHGYAPPAQGYGHAAYGHPGGHYKEEHHQERHGGPGMGAVAASVVGGAALGFAGGMVADEVFDSFGDDEGGDEEA